MSAPDPSRTRRPAWIGAVAPIALPLVALAASLAVREHISQTVFIFFFPAVAIASWVGGLVGGLVATVLSIALADYYVIPPYRQFVGLAGGDGFRLVLFGTIAVLISRLSATYSRALDASRTLARELSEREGHLKEQLEEGQTLTEELEQTNVALHEVNTELVRAQARGHHLFTLAARLSEAATPVDVAEVMFREGLEGVGADAGSLAMLIDRAGQPAEVEMSRSHGYSAQATATYQRFPLTAGRPLSDSLLQRTPVLIANEAEWRQRYPAVAEVALAEGHQSFVAVPVLLGERAMAAVCFSFREPRVFDDDLRAYLEAMARLYAQALERARAYEAESRARARTATIVDSITDGFVVFDRELRYTYVNRRAEELWGRPSSELLGRTIVEVFPQLASSQFVAMFGRVLAERRMHSIEDYSPSVGRWVETRAYPSEDGGLVVYFQDVTERRRSQDATAFLAEASQLLASSSNYTETLSNLAQAAVPRLGDWCAVDILDDPASTAWPPSIRRVAVVHQDPEKIALGRQMTTEYPTDWSQPHGLPQVIREGKPMFLPVVTDEMIVAGARDKRHLELLRALSFSSIMVVPLLARGRVLGNLTLCMTESGRRYSDADLALAEDLARRAGVAIDNARLLRDAEAANATKTEFLRTISHELRQPLNATVSFLQLWELGLRGPLTEVQRDDLHRIQRNQRHLMSLIEDLLSFTRLEAGRLEVEHTRVVIDDALQGLEAMIAPQMAARGVDFTYTGCDRSLVVLGDRDRIVQICLNLLTNALRATARGGRVQMECLGAFDAVSVIVSDTGVGIPADKLDTIFSPFTQLGRALNQPKEGAGLGLAISRGLAEAMGGTLRATSVPDVGSTFVLQLPREPDQPGD